MLEAKLGILDVVARLGSSELYIEFSLYHSVFWASFLVRSFDFWWAQVFTFWLLFGMPGYALGSTCLCPGSVLVGSFKDPNWTIIL